MTDSAESEPQAVADVADFDAFFAERKAKEKPRGVLRLFGCTYTLPRQIPLAYKVLEARNKDRDDFDALKEVLTPVFGAAALDFWAEQGMGHIDFEIVLVWAGENMRDPGSMSMAEAAAAVEKAEAGEGKDPTGNREQRRAAAKAKPKPKKRTSGARS